MTNPTGSITTGKATSVYEDSVGLPGIDDLHTYNKPAINPQVPNAQIPELPYKQPYTDSRAPIETGNWWQNRSASQEAGIDSTNNFQGRTDEPYSDMLRPRDPRNYTIELNRPTTQDSGPQFFYQERAPFEMWAKQWWGGSHASAAYAANVYSPMSFGDGKGIRRFRNTQRNIPPLLEQNVEAVNDQPPAAGWNQMAAGIEEYW